MPPSHRTTPREPLRAGTAGRRKGAARAAGALALFGALSLAVASALVYSHSPPAASPSFPASGALALASPFASEARASGTGRDISSDAENSLFTDYRDVPGVTQEEIDELERLKLSRSFLVYGSCATAEAFVTADGRVGGFSARMASWMSDLLGMDVQPRIYQWDVLMKSLDDGEVDFTGELSPTEERRREFMMTPPIAERGTRYFRLKGAAPLDTIVKERRLRFAFLAGSVTPRPVAAASAHPFDVIETADYSTAYLLLSTGLADAFIDESPAEAAFDSYGDVVASDFFPVLFSEVSLASKNPEARAVISVVSKAIEAGAMRGLMAMYTNGAADYRRHKYTLMLGPDEFRFLERRISSGDPILYAAEDDNYPVSFYNGEEGEFQGMAVDVLKEVSLVTGVEFRPANPGPVEWPSLLQMLEDGEASVITELIRSPEREGRYLWADPPFSSDRYAMLSLSSTPDRNLNEIRFSEVGLVSETAWAEAFRGWFKDHSRTREFPSTDLAFEALERGEVDLVMGSRSLHLGMTNYRERTGFKVNHVFEGSYASSFGLNIHETMVRSLLSKALPLVDCETISNRWLQRTFDYRGKLARSRVPRLAALAAALAVLLAVAAKFLWRKSSESARLESEVRERTAELACQKEEALSSLKAKGDFLARMSHEIRTPMNAVIGMAELALREKIPDEASEMITNILRAGNSLLTIINDILDFSKIESGAMEIVAAPYRLGQLVSDAVGIAAVRVAGKPVQFLVEADPRLPATLVGDEVRIRQLMLNLLSNAAKYTKSGFVKLRVETGTYVSPEGLCAWPRPAEGGGPAPEPVSQALPGDTCEWRPKSKEGEFCVWPPAEPDEPPDGPGAGPALDKGAGPGDAAPAPYFALPPPAAAAGDPASRDDGAPEGGDPGPGRAGSGGQDPVGQGAEGRARKRAKGRAPDAPDDADDDAEDPAKGAPAAQIPRTVALRIAVSDSGIGIKPEDMGKLFGTFSQFDQRRNRGIEGTGLG
ncbi:MAG: transporter substrate-binding domain-containing protein, partial [Deltaproteobacteria bacterium]|nr:transporter substrate-binding domain-containing protein [Deltaproteobacteria bacterium]